MEQSEKKTFKQKKSKLPLMLGVVAAVVVLVIAAAVFFLGGKLSLASAVEKLGEQFEEKMTTGVYAAATLLEKYEDEAKVSATLELTELPESLDDGSATATAVKGSKIDIDFLMSTVDKKLDIDAGANIAGMMEIGLELYADEEVVQIKVPMLSEDTFELENDDILGQLTQVIPDIGLSGGKISFEKLDIDTLVAEFSEKYKERLDKANEKIVINEGGKVEHSAFGKENVKCDTFNIQIPTEVINEYADCIKEYISDIEMLKMLGDVLSDENLTPDGGVELTVYTAKNGLFASNSIVALEIGEYEAEDDEKIKILLNGEKNVLDDVTVIFEGETLLTYASKTEGTIAEDDVLFVLDGESVKLTSNYDSKTGKFSSMLVTDAAGTEVKTSLEFFVKDDKGTVKAEELTVTIDIDGEQLVLEGNVECSAYESPTKISETPKEFNLQNIFSIIASLSAGMGGLAM